MELNPKYTEEDGHIRADAIKILWYKSLLLSPSSVERDFHLLVNAGVNLDWKDNRQRTVLHKCAGCGCDICHRLASLLIKSGASTDIIDAGGRTARDIDPPLFDEIYREAVRPILTI